VLGSTLATHAHRFHIGSLVSFGGTTSLLMGVMVFGYVRYFPEDAPYPPPYPAEVEGTADGGGGGGSHAPPQIAVVADADDALDDAAAKGGDRAAWCGDDVGAAAGAGDAAATATGVVVPAVAAPLTRRTRSRSPSQSSTTSEKEPIVTSADMFDGLLLVVKYPYVRLVLCISCLFEVVLTVLDYEVGLCRVVFEREFVVA